MVEYPHGQVRAVTHYGIGRAEVETTIAATRDALAETAPASASGAASTDTVRERATPVAH